MKNKQTNKFPTQPSQMSKEVSKKEPIEEETSQKGPGEGREYLLLYGIFVQDSANMILENGGAPVKGVKVRGYNLHDGGLFHTAHTGKDENFLYTVLWDIPSSYVKTTIDRIESMYGKDTLKSTDEKMVASMYTQNSRTGGKICDNQERVEAFIEGLNEAIDKYVKRHGECDFDKIEMDEETEFVCLKKSDYKRDPFHVWSKHDKSSGKPKTCWGEEIYGPKAEDYEEFGENKGKT